MERSLEGLLCLENLEQAEQMVGSAGYAAVSDTAEEYMGSSAIVS